jgi:hypothetical protein
MNPVTVARGINVYYPRPDRLECVSDFLFRHERHFDVHAGTQQYNIKVVANRWRADQHVVWRMHASGAIAETGGDFMSGQSQGKMQSCQIVCPEG